MKRYLVAEASAHEGPPEVVGFFDDLKDVKETSATAVELATGRVFRIDQPYYDNWHEVTE